MVTNLEMHILGQSFFKHSLNATMLNVHSFSVRVASNLTNKTDHSTDAQFFATNIGRQSSIICNQKVNEMNKTKLV